ncbi:MAG TPA: isocitrate/isopropylmalate dehydrogenase family protein [Erysipelothrix sp.]|nr:isocitrate/isopropylmalate dehydrogenase family protein [Erysipelothrix sp.]
MKEHNITLIKGDGIGPEISNVCVEALDALGLNIKWDEKLAGIAALEADQELLSEDVLSSIETNKVCLKAPLTTPIGEGFRSVNVSLRKHFDLYANIRPIKSVDSIKTKFEDIDLIIFRENTEDIYMGLEKQISDTEAHSIKVITKEKTERIAKEAFEYALKHDYPKVTVVTKANIMKLSDGLFLKTVRDVKKDYPNIELEEVLVDNMAMQLVMHPNQYGVIVTSNLYGDILSDLAAGLVGGLGLIAGANIGEEVAIFEAVHGTAPDIAGKDLANPTALLNATVMMLEHIGENEKALILDKSIKNVLKDKDNFTKDLGGSASTTHFKKKLIQEIKSYG